MAYLFVKYPSVINEFKTSKVFLLISSSFVIKLLCSNLSSLKIAIFIHYKLRIAVSILDFQWMKMI